MQRKFLANRNFEEKNYQPGCHQKATKNTKAARWTNTFENVYFEQLLPIVQLVLSMTFMLVAPTSTIELCTNSTNTTLTFTIIVPSHQVHTI